MQWQDLNTLEEKNEIFRIPSFKLSRYLYFFFLITSCYQILFFNLMLREFEYVNTFIHIYFEMSFIFILIIILKFVHLVYTFESSSACMHVCVWWYFINKEFYIPPQFNITLNKGLQSSKHNLIFRSNYGLFSLFKKDFQFLDFSMKK